MIRRRLIFVGTKVLQNIGFNRYIFFSVKKQKQENSKPVRNPQNKSQKHYFPTFKLIFYFLRVLRCYTFRYMLVRFYHKMRFQPTKYLSHYDYDNFAMSSIKPKHWYKTKQTREWLTFYYTNDTILFWSFIILTLLCHCACSDTMIMPEYRGNYALYKQIPQSRIASIIPLHIDNTNRIKTKALVQAGLKALFKHCFGYCQRGRGTSSASMAIEKRNTFI